MGLKQMWPTLSAALMLCLVLETAGYMADFPGPYCETRLDGCCKNRTDSCAVPISSKLLLTPLTMSDSKLNFPSELDSDTLCYCDEFCVRGISGDCCPDYEKFCLGIDDPPPNPITVQCSHNGVQFGQFDTIKDNCNLWWDSNSNAINFTQNFNAQFSFVFNSKCQVNGVTSCESNECLTDENLIHNVNRISESLGWQATKYPEFWGRTYQTGIDLRLGTKEPTRKVKSMSKLSNKIEQLPREFDSVKHWPGLVTGIHDQGWCGSSWAVSTSSVASDRFGIQTKGKEAVELAPQQLLSCVRRQTGCSGGHLDWAWNYIRKIG